MKSLLTVSLLVLCASFPLSFSSTAEAQGGSTGQAVSELAKSGVRGEALSAEVHELQAEQGIGKANCKGKKKCKAINGDKEQVAGDKKNKKGKKQQAEKKGQGGKKGKGMKDKS